MKKIILVLVLITTTTFASDNWAFIGTSEATIAAYSSWSMIPAKKKIQKPKFRRMVYVGAVWCGACKQVKQSALPPLIKAGWKISDDDLGHIQVLDYDKNDVSRYNVTMLPTWILLEDEKEVSRTIGYLSPQGVGDAFKP